jgi:hypothetical protein
LAVAFRLIEEGLGVFDDVDLGVAGQRAEGDVSGEEGVLGLIICGPRT